jgi:hypothetical protein
MPTTDVAEESLGCRIDPPDHPGRVEDVTRHADAVQSPFDIATDY